ncbi:MAG: hypothetical protein Q9192_009139, partial [Flavoplaca navasiana]
TKILTSNPPSPPTSSPSSPIPTKEPEENENDKISIFATPVALDTLAPYLFPSLAPSLLRPPLTEAYQTLQQNFGFYVSVLNLYYLLLTNTHIRNRLDIADLHSNHDIGGSFIGPLAQAVERFREGLSSGEGELATDLGEGEGTAGLSDLSILEDRLKMVREGIKGLNGL